MLRPMYPVIRLACTTLVWRRRAHSGQLCGAALLSGAIAVSGTTLSGSRRYDFAFLYIDLHAMSGVLRSMMVWTPSRFSFPPLKTWEARKSFPSRSTCPASCKSRRLGIPYLWLRDLVSLGGFCQAVGSFSSSSSSIFHVCRSSSISCTTPPHPFRLGSLRVPLHWMGPTPTHRWISCNTPRWRWVGRGGSKGDHPMVMCHAPPPHARHPKVWEINASLDVGTWGVRHDNQRTRNAVGRQRKGHHRWRIESRRSPLPPIIPAAFLCASAWGQIGSPMDFAKGHFKLTKRQRACPLAVGQGTSSLPLTMATLVTRNHDVWYPTAVLLGSSRESINTIAWYKHKWIDDALCDNHGWVDLLHPLNETDPRHFLQAYRSNVQCCVLAHRKNLGALHCHAQLHQYGRFFAKKQCKPQTHALLISFQCVAPCLPSVEIGSTTSSTHGMWTEDLRVYSLAFQNRVPTLPFPNCMRASKWGLLEGQVDCPTESLDSTLKPRDLL